MATSKPTPAPSDDPLPTRAGGIRRIIRPLLMILVLLLVAAASAGVTWFIAKRSQPPSGAPVQLGVGQSDDQADPPGADGQPAADAAPPVPPADIPPPIFVPIEPFTVTLQNADTERILHVGLTLRVNDEQSRTRLEKYMPEVRSRILMVLSAQSPVDVQTQQGKTDMIDAIKQTVNLPFTPQPDGQHVTDVLYTAFVVQ